MHDGDGKIRNRAPFIAPSGALAYQDKQAMTRFEAEEWGVVGGDQPAHLRHRRSGKIGVSICYDSLNSPSMSAPAGQWRAQTSSSSPAAPPPPPVSTACAFHARARAVENQCYTAIVPAGGHRRLVRLHRRKPSATPALFGPPAMWASPMTASWQPPPRINQPGLIFAQTDIDLKHVKQVRTGGSVLNHRDWPDQIPPCPIVSLA